MIRVEPLADHPHVVATIAHWHWEEWGGDDPDSSEAEWAAALARRKHRDRVPMMFVAFDHAEPVGSAALVEHDMSTRKDLTPWLAGVYVLPPHRRRGIAARLVRRVMEEAGRLGVETLYLYTNGAEPLYEKLGWRELTRETYQGRTVTIMSIRIEATVPVTEQRDAPESLRRSGPPQE